MNKITFFLIVFSLTGVVSCSNGGQNYSPAAQSNYSSGDANNSNSSSPNMQQDQNSMQATQKTEAEIRKELFANESAHPLDFLSIQATWKVNLLANTILEGKISNVATISGFKNVKIKASFFSKTGMLLGEEYFIIMEFVKPRGYIEFRQKITGYYKDASNVKCEVVSAEAY
jgi:hypothetical protein